MNGKDRTVRRRIGFCVFVSILAFSVLGIRAWQLHFNVDARVASLKSRQEIRNVKLSAHRGTIFDSLGNPLAVSLKTPSVFADPSQIENVWDFSVKAARVLGLSPRALRKRIADPSRKFVWLKRRADPSIEAAVQKLDLPGLHVMHEWTRMYPQRELAAQVVGFVGNDGIGLEGIERHYDQLLKSRPIVIQTERDAKGRAIFSEFPDKLSPDYGADVFLTIDTNIQNLTEESLNHAAKASGSKKAFGVVMEVATGKILAMSSYPSINPNRLDQTSAALWRNQPVQEIYEPGSTFKVFTLAAAVEDHLVKPNQLVQCTPGSLVLNGRKIRTHFEKNWLTPRQIMKFSDNIGTARIALALGQKRLQKTVSDFGFGEETGIDFPGEAKGLVPNEKKWRDIKIANVSFGQSINVSGIQLLAAVAAIADNGMWTQPYLGETAEFRDGHRLKLRTSLRRQRVLSKEAAEKITSWMEAVTEDDGTGFLAATRHYRVAGKTGTSQKVDPITKTYSRDRITSSFVGFAPVSSPRLAALFVFDEPDKGDYGGSLAAPVFSRVMEQSLAYLEVKPDKDYVSDDVRDLLASSIHPSPEIERNAETEFAGLTVREVLRKAVADSLDVEVVGSGVAFRHDQRTKNGRKVLRVYFSQEKDGGRS